MKLLMGCLLFLGLLGSAYPVSPDDAGKALLERTCTNCHSLAGVQSQHNGREQWTSIVDDMVSRGAEASDAELQQIIDYLVKTQGKPVNVNKAAAGELAGVLEIPADTASAIVAYREKNGDFKTFDDLCKVPGIDSKDLENKKGRLDFGAAK